MTEQTEAELGQDLKMWTGKVGPACVSTTANRNSLFYFYGLIFLKKLRSFYSAAANEVIENAPQVLHAARMNI